MTTLNITAWGFPKAPGPKLQAPALGDWKKPRAPVHPYSAPRMDPPPPQPSASNDDTVTYQQLYRAYLNFWNSLNNCVDDEYKIIPENGTRPTYREAKNLWKAMKQPRRRKLLWVATGFLHDEFPNDEAEFRREEEAGLINETNVTTGADAELESSSDDDDDIDIPDMDDENIPPVGAGAPQNALDRLYGGRPAEIQDISSDEEPPQDPVNANAINDLGLSLSVTLRPETPLAILEASVGGYPDMSPVQAEIASTDSAAAALASPVLVATVPPVATLSVADQLAAAEVGNEVVEDSQMDECVDAFVETVQDDCFIEEPDLSPPRSPIHDLSQMSALNDSPVPTPQSSYSNSRIPTSTAPKGISPPKKRKIIEIDDESAEETKDFKPENDKTSYIDEQIASTEQNQTHKSKSTKKFGRKKPSQKPTTSKPTPRVRTRSAIQADKRAKKIIIIRRLMNELDSDDSSSNSVLGVLDSDNVSDDSESDSETSSLDGFIQPDDSVSEDEAYDKSITMSDYQRTANSEDLSTQSTLNDEIYTRNDSVERDLPATVPRATVKSTPTTPKTTPLFAHLGKSRYSSDAPATTPRQPTAPSFSSKCGTFNQRRTTKAPVAQRRFISNSSSSRGSKAAGPVRQTRAKSVERNDGTATPAPTRQRQRSGDGKSAKRSDTTRAPSKRQSRVPSVHSRRSTSSARFGSATSFVDDDSESSRPSMNSIHSSLTDGYEEINKNNKRAINGILYIIHEINGKKYYRRYKPCGSMGVFNSLACHDFYCIKCRINQKDTLVKTMVKSNRIFAETNHVPACELKEYNIED